MNREKIIEKVSEFVGEKRLIHILGTETECKRLAEIFSLSGEETEKLKVAALLHDITKGFSVKEHCEYMEKIGREFSEENLKSEKTLHAITGAFMAKELFSELADDLVFSAILFHTTGKEDMSLPQKLLYLADYIEPNRTFKDCVELRKYFYDRIENEDREKVLDDTLTLSFDLTISDLIKNGCIIHSDTVKARNYLVSHKKT